MELPDTVEALGVFLVAVLPGAAYVWSFERVVGRWGIGLSDRLLRFTAASAFFLACLSFPLYRLWVVYLHHSIQTPGGVKYENRIANGEHLPWWMFAVPVFYVVVPVVVGSLVGRAVRSQTWLWQAVGRVVAGRDPAPRGWDHLWSSRPSAVVRLRLKDNGPWLGGYFGDQSYASGYPEEPQDLYLETAFAMDQDDGSFVQDEAGNPDDLGTSLLVRWEEVQFLELFDE